MPDQPAYQALRRANVWAYHRTIEAAGAAILAVGLDVPQAAIVEGAMVDLACQLLCVRPWEAPDV